MAEVPDLSRQRSIELLRAGDQARDVADLGAVTNGGDHSGRRAIGHQGRGIGHVAAIGERRVVGQFTGLFGDRNRFTGQGGLVDLQVADLQQAQVRRNLVARSQHDQIARNQVAGVDPLFVPGAHDRCLGGQRARQRSEGVQGLVFLCEAKNSVEQDHGENHSRIDIATQGQLDHDRSHQDIHQRLVELLDKALQRALALGGGQGIGTESFLAPGDFELIEPAFATGIEEVDHLACRQVVPVLLQEVLHGLYSCTVVFLRACSN
jgi:hypothetical protein